MFVPCWQDWFTVAEHYHRMNATISDLIMGNSYKFRVYSENKCGISEEAITSEDSAVITKTGEALVRRSHSESSQSLQGEPGEQVANESGKVLKNKKKPSKFWKDWKVFFSSFFFHNILRIECTWKVNGPLFCHTVENKLPRRFDLVPLWIWVPRPSPVSLCENTRPACDLTQAACHSVTV